MPNTESHIIALRTKLDIARKDQWSDIVLCLQEWDASGAPFNEYPWISKLYPYCYNMATKIYPDFNDDMLSVEAGSFAGRFAAELHELYVDPGKGEAFIRSGIPPVETRPDKDEASIPSGIPPVETRPNNRCIWIWLLVIAFGILAAIIFGTSSSSSSTSSPRPLSPERAIILKDFQAARETIPSLAIKMTSAPTGVRPSSSPKLNESTTIIVSLMDEFIEFFPAYFTQLDDSMEVYLILGTSNEHTQVRDNQIHAQKTVNTTAQMQSLFTRLNAELAAGQTMILNFIHLEKDEDKKEAAQQLLNIMGYLHTSTSIARYSNSQIHDSMLHFATSPLNAGSSTSSFGSSSASASASVSASASESASSASGENSGAQSSLASPVRENNHGAPTQQPQPSSPTLTAFPDINSIIREWTVQAGDKDKFLYRGLFAERLVGAQQGGFGGELVEDKRKSEWKWVSG
ncbi:MAG: hypothetical protein Q9192_001280 [Flavoplaca navasiana]